MKRWLQALAPLVLVACSSTTDEVATTSEEIGATTAPMILVPTSSAAIGACADSLAMTFCSAADAAKAADDCERAIADDAKSDCDADRGCVFAFPTERAGSCHAGVTYATKAACSTPQPDDCSFYASCMESTIACGPDGYARSFGEPLCYKFLERREDFSAHAQHWLKGVRQCLQQQMVPLLAKSETCDSLESAAYASHVTCYTNPSDSICQVAFPDLLVLFGIIHDELFSAQGFQQVKGVAQACITQWFGGGRSHIASPPVNVDARTESLFRDITNAEDHDALSRILDVARMQNAASR